MNDIQRSGASSTRDKIKREARRLFATRGIDGVSTREIMKASGQKNTASLGYYFGSKENLIKELILDGAKLINDRRNSMLDDLESSGGPSTVREIADILVFSAVGLSDDAPIGEDTFSRFITHIGQHHPNLFLDTLGDQFASGLTRCFQHIRQLMPNMPSVVKSQRLGFVTGFLGAVLSSRESSLTMYPKYAGLWHSEGSLKHISQSITAIIESPFDVGAFVDTDLDSIHEDARAKALLGTL